MSGIKVLNLSGQKIEVAINQWGDDGGTGNFTIDDKDSEHWSRSNRQGFVMVITPYKISREKGSYWFIKPGTDITVYSLDNVEGALAALPNPYIESPSAFKKRSA